MKIRNLSLVLCSFFVLLVSGCADTSREIERVNQQRAQPIIEALDKYMQDRGVAPPKLGVLVPEYLPKLPMSLENAEFEYSTVVDIYTLCFGERTWNGKSYGCCYLRRFEEWDCTRGVE
ncbi:MAG: hypothetical protein HZC40_09025 [Chloroflexi bacterium]|nr:hypothetical protein [Chloroflexota bacterium]